MDEVRHALASDQVAGLRGQVEPLVGADWTRVDDEAVLDAAVELEELGRLVSLVQCALAGVVNQRDLDGQRGYSSPVNFLRDMLRIPVAEAKKRLTAADQFLPRTALTGEALPAEYPHLGEALAEGAVSLEHARVAARTLRKLPDAVSLDDRDQAEQQLTRLARDWCPTELGTCATHLATAAACSTAATRHQRSATRTTPPTGPTAAPPTSTPPPWSANPTTDASTAKAGKSR